MKDPQRLLDRDATPAELMLLRAGLSEGPSNEAMQRLAAALGISAGAVTVATKSAAAGLVARGAVSKIAGKWLILGALGVAGGAAIVFASRGSEPRAVARPAHPAVSIPGPIATTPVVEYAPAPVSSGEAPAAAGAAQVGPATPAMRAASPSIAKEIAALDSARRLLSGGNPAGALRALDDYQSLAKAGMLRQEATLLRIEALAAAGNTGDARRIAHRFLRDHPDSPHEKRIRALLGETP